MSHLKISRISDLQPVMKNVNCVFIVLEKGDSVKTKDGLVMSRFWVADASGSIEVSVWDDISPLVKLGDVMKMTGGYCALFRSSLTLYAGRHASVERIGEFEFNYSETPNMSSNKNWAAVVNPRP
eukprot:Sdes_comp17608_c1_seq1m6870